MTIVSSQSIVSSEWSLEWLDIDVSGSIASGADCGPDDVTWLTARSLNVSGGVECAPGVFRRVLW
jgi:hypothetical protein